MEELCINRKFSNQGSTVLSNWETRVNLIIRSVAQKISFPVIAGDVIVLGTDGLFDNVHDLELETVVNSAADTRKSDVPGTLAWRWRIAQYALDNAKSKELYTRLLENVGELVLYVMVESMMILLSLSPIFRE